MHSDAEESDVEKEIDKTDNSIETWNRQHVIQKVRIRESQEHDGNGKSRVLYPGLESDGPAFVARLPADPSHCVTKEVSDEWEHRSRGPYLPAGREHAWVDDADKCNRNGDGRKTHYASEL